MYTLAVAGAIAILSITQWPLVRGTASPDNDALMYYGPYHMLVGTAAAHGKLLLWNPLSNAGAPDYIEPQIGAVSPAVLATASLARGAEWGFRLYWFLIWLAGGAGLIALGRHLGAPPWGCFCVASGLMLSGFYTGHAEHTSILASASHLPWLLWRVDVALLTRRWSAVAQTGVILGLSGLGGYPGVLVLNGLACGFWVIGRVLTMPGPRGRHALWALTSLIVVGAIAGAVLSPTYVAFWLGGRGFTYRTGLLPRSLVIESNSLLPWNLATLAGPASVFWPLTPQPDGSMRSIYLGVVIPTLAAYALMKLDRGWRLWLAFGVALFLGAALGSSLPVRGWFYEFVPPTRFFRHSALFRWPSMEFISVLALLGARDIQKLRGARRLRRFAAVTSVVASVLCVIYGIIGSLVPPPKTAAYITTLFLWAVIPLAALVLSWYKHPRRSIWILVSTFVAIASVDALLTARVSAPQVYGRHLTSWRDLDRLRQRDIVLQRLVDRDETSTNNFNLPLGIPVLRSYASLASPLYEAFVSDPDLKTMALGRNRFWFVTAASVLAPSEQMIARLGESMRALGSAVAVIHTPDVMSRPESWVSDGRRVEPVPAVLIHPSWHVYDATRLKFEVNAPRRGWIVITDRWAPGWYGSVNGVETSVWGANGVFRAIPVGLGHSVIEMHYRPVGYPWLLALSWITVAVVFGLGLRRAIGPRYPE